MIERWIFAVLVGASIGLGAWFLVELGAPWRSEVPGQAWLQASMAWGWLAFDVVFLLAIFSIVVPAWIIALILVAQDAAFTFRLVRIRAARAEDRQTNRRERHG